MTRVGRLISNGGIYQIRNILDNKVYIGSTNNFTRRFKEHQSALKRNKHINPHLQYAYNKYGSSNFVYEILEYINNEDDLIIREQFWFDSINPCDSKKGYNVANEATDCYRGPCTEETRRKISQTKKGKPAWNKGKKCPQLSGENHWIYGKTHSLESRKKLSESHKGKIVSDITRQRMSEAQLRCGNRPPVQQGINSYHAHPVMCLLDGKIFPTVSACSDYYKVSFAKVKRHCLGLLQRGCPQYKYITKQQYIDYKMGE